MIKSVGKPVDPQSLAVVAKAVAERYLEPAPARVRAVSSTWLPAERATYGPVGAQDADDRPVFVIEMEGKFRHIGGPFNPSRPMGARERPYAHAIVEAETGRLLMSGIGGNSAGLDKLGEPFDL